MREPSILVREAAAEQLEERQSDWAYSKPVGVAGDAAEGLDCGTQCMVHMVCVCVEFKRRQNRRFSGLDSGEGGAGNSSHSSQYVSLADHLNDEDTGSVVKHVECVNTMFSFIWWIVGFYWVSAGGQNLARASPQLYWLCIVFLGFDVFFVVFCIALLYAVVDQDGAVELNPKHKALT